MTWLKRLFWMGPLGLITLLSWGAALPPLETVSSVDLSRYMGKWYEIAKYPNRFQSQCVSDTSASYSLIPEGGVQVMNRCRLANGQMDEALGVARQIGGAHSPKFEVRFAPAWLSFIPYVWGDYWIIDLDDAYQWVVVSEPRRKYLWILARSPEMDREVYQGILERLKAQHYALEDLEPSPQIGSTRP